MMRVELFDGFYLTTEHSGACGVLVLVDDEGQAHVAKGMSGSDLMLVGRVVAQEPGVTVEAKRLFNEWGDGLVGVCW